MDGVNKVILIGRLGQDPEIKNVNGKKVANFSIATTESYKDKNGQKVENTEWHNIVIWGGLADVVESYVHKGDQLYLEGKLMTRKWEKEGVTYSRTEVVCNQMQMVGSKDKS
jgi:single-strand DNA-binding protein